MLCYHRFMMLVIMLLVLLSNLGSVQNQYVPHNEIGLPFKLVEAKFKNCDYSYSYDGPFCCTNGMMVEFPAIPALKGVKLSVVHVDYESHQLLTCDPKHCLPILFLKLHNSSIHPLQFDSEHPEYSNMLTNISFFDCSSIGTRYPKNYYKHAQNTSVCPIYAVFSGASVLDKNLVSCTKMFALVSSVPANDLRMNRLRLRWPKPKSDVENFYGKHAPSKIRRIVLPTTGSGVLVLLCIAFFYIYHLKKKGEDEARLEKFLKDYRALKPTRFSYADLKRITNHFKDKLGEGAHGAVFKGKLSIDIPVAVKVLNNSEGDGKEFINEVGTMGKIHHINVVRLLGFCAEGFHRALVYDFFPYGSLQKFICSPDNKESFLGWSKLQQIAVGIAKGIEYLHHGCDFRILHFDINPRNVLLDHNFGPKVSDFGLAKLCSKNHSTVSMTAARGTMGYIAPEVFSRNFGNVSYKSDVYSYGMMLLEMVGGRRNMLTSEETFQILYPEWIHNLIEREDINIHIEDKEDNIVAKKLAIVGLWCIQWHPINRPSMRTVIQMLEGEGDKLKVPPTPFHSTACTSTSIVIPARHLNLGLEVIHE